jgi:hypothetical protein
MKKLIFLLAIVFTSNLGFGGNGIALKDDTKLVSGKVIDKISGEEIAGAEIKVDDKVIYTDLNGNFSANINVNHTTAVITYISYQDTKVTIDPFTYNTFVIELASK